VAFRRVWIGRAFGPQKLICCDAQDGSEGIEPIDRHTVLASLERAHICTIDLGEMGKFLLRKPPFKPPLSEVHGKNVSNTHPP